MENNYRNNIIEFSNIYLNKYFNKETDFNGLNFTNYIYIQLFNLNLEKTGYGLDYSTKQMTNDIGDLKIYNENDPKKTNYLEEIKPGDLVFFHTKSIEHTTPTPNNNYPGHVGIYLGNQKFIHETDEEKITIDIIDESWLNILVASRDIIKEIITKPNYNQKRT